MCVYFFENKKYIFSCTFDLCGQVGDKNFSPGRFPETGLLLVAWYISNKRVQTSLILTDEISDSNASYVITDIKKEQHESRYKNIRYERKTDIKNFLQDFSGLPLTIPWWRFLSYRNHSIDLLHKSMDSFVYDRDLHHERVKHTLWIWWSGWSDIDAEKVFNQFYRRTCSKRPRKFNSSYCSSDDRSLYRASSKRIGTISHKSLRPQQHWRA